MPYESWSRAVLGKGINELLGWERNCYDRLVHCSFGLLIAPGLVETAERWGRVRGGWWTGVFAVGAVSLFGNVYEVIEWLIAESLSPENAEQYNGQQGDVFDPQKDLALSLVGSVIGAVGMCVWRGSSGKRNVAC